MRFILVHGGWHGAWCWRYVIPELEALGHTAAAEFTAQYWDNPTRRSYIACLEDRSGILPLTEKCSAQLRLTGSYVLRSSHSPFLSRPRDLAELLERIAVPVHVGKSHSGRTP